MLASSPQPLGDFALAATVDLKFTTFAAATGAPTQLAGVPAISVYKSNGTTESTAGVTLTVDFDGLTGMNHVSIDTSSDGAFYAAGEFQVVITTGTVSATSVIGYVVASFSLNNRSLQSRIPAALVSGRIDASVGAYPGNTVQTGDSFARLGAAGAGLTALGDTRIANLDAAVSTRSTYAGGAVASVTGNIGGNLLGTLSSTERNAISDALLKRDWTLVTGEAARSCLNAFRFIRNKWAVAANTLTVTKEDDTTAAWTAALTVDATASPITSSDPT